MKLIFKILRYLSLLCFVAIVAFEITFRIIRKEQWVKHVYPKIYSPDTICGYKGIPFIKGEIKRPSIVKSFQLNNQGFYGPDFTVQKPDSIFRIIVTGTSGVEGIWANHIESFPFKLNQMFQKEGCRVEVLNCAISGTERDYQNLRLMENYLSKYGPDIILYEGKTEIVKGNYHRDTYGGYSIMFTGNNDRERQHSRYIVKEKVNRLNHLKLFTDLWDVSYLLRFYARRADNKKIPSLAHCLGTYAANKADSWQYSQFTVFNFDESLELINQLDSALKINKCKLILFDYNNNNKAKILENRHKINFSYIFLNISGDNLVHKYDGHFNEIADEKIAQQLFDRLYAHFIPENYRE